MSKSNFATQWNVSEFLKGNNEHNFAILLLNQPVLNEAVFVTIWNKGG
jgi:hypothetical protein